MKRIFAFLLTLALCFALTACATENKYAELEKMLDEGRYGDAMTYILSLQGSNSSSVPLWGIVQPGDGTYTDEDLDADKEPDAEVLALIDELMGEWVIAGEDEDAPQKFIFRADGTCTVDSTEMTWKREATSLQESEGYFVLSTFLSIWDGEKERYRIQQPTKSDAGELSFSVRKVSGMVTAVGGYRYICPDNYEAVELTMDNWQEYFEIVEKPYHSTNALGDVTDMGVSYYFSLKEEYFSRLSKYMSIDAAAEIRYIRQEYNVQINSDGKTYTLGNTAGTPFNETTVQSISRGQRDYTDDTSSYIGISFASSHLFHDDAGYAPGAHRICMHIRDISLLRIQGTLYFVKPQ